MQLRAYILAGILLVFSVITFIKYNSLGYFDTWEDRRSAVQDIVYDKVIHGMPPQAADYFAICMANVIINIAERNQCKLSHVELIEIDIEDCVLVDPVRYMVFDSGYVSCFAKTYEWFYSSRQPELR